MSHQEVMSIANTRALQAAPNSPIDNIGRRRRNTNFGIGKDEITSILPPQSRKFPTASASRGAFRVQPKTWNDDDDKYIFDHKKTFSNDQNRGKHDRRYTPETSSSNMHKSLSTPTSSMRERSLSTCISTSFAGVSQRRIASNSSSRRSMSSQIEEFNFSEHRSRGLKTSKAATPIVPGLSLRPKEQPRYGPKDHDPKDGTPYINDSRNLSRSDKIIASGSRVVFNENRENLNSKSISSSSSSSSSLQCSSTSSNVLTPFVNPSKDSCSRGRSSYGTISMEQNPPRRSSRRKRQEPEVIDLLSDDDDNAESSNEVNMFGKEASKHNMPPPGYFYAKSVFVGTKQFFPRSRNCLINVTENGLEFAVLGEVDTITIEDHGSVSCQNDEATKILEQHAWSPPEVRFTDVHKKLITHNTFDEGYCGIQFSLSKYNRYGQVSKARQNKIERIIDSLSKIHHRDLKPRVDQDVEIVETPDPIEIYIVTDETNLLIFEQEVNRYNERNGNVGDPPPIMYEQMSPGDKESFFMHLLLSDESNDIFKQVIFDHATCEEKETSATYGTRGSKRRKLEIGENPEDSVVILLYPMEENAQDVITMVKGDLKRLEPGEYLNDNIIDFKIKILMEELKARDDSRHSRIHVYNSLFYTKLTESCNEKEGFDLVKRWTKNVDIFEKDFLVVPINLVNHWSLVVIVRPALCMLETDEDDPRDLTCHKSCILFMDSLGLHRAATIGKKLRAYLAHEWADKRCTDQEVNAIDIKGFPLASTHGIKTVSCNQNIPRQTNGYDCGVYTIKFFEMVINVMPSSTLQDIENKFGFARDAFGFDAINQEREDLKLKINELSSQWQEMLRLRKINEDATHSNSSELENGSDEIISGNDYYTNTGEGSNTQSQERRLLNENENENENELKFKRESESME